MIPTVQLVADTLGHSILLMLPVAAGFFFFYFALRVFIRWFFYGREEYHPRTEYPHNPPTPVPGYPHNPPTPALTYWHKSLTNGAATSKPRRFIPPSYRSH